MTKKKIIFGMDVTVSSLALIGVMILLYVILERHHFRIDLTANKRYSLSSETQNVLKNLKKKVSVTAFFREGQEKRMVEDLLNEYTFRTKNLEVKFIDPVRDPVAAKRHNISDLNTTVFESGAQKKEVRADEVFGMSGMGMGGPQGIEFKGEQAYTSAILKVTEETQKKVCFSEGHGERNIDGNDRDGYSMIKEMIEKANYLVEKTNLLAKGSVPKDCRVLVVAGPRQPFYKEELNVLKKFLDANGKALFLLDPTSRESMLPVLLQTYGVRILRSIVVDPESHFFIDPFSIIPQYQVHDITKELQKNRYASVFPEAQVAEQGEKPSSDVTVSSLLQTTPGSWAETNLQDENVKYDEGKDKKGPLSLAVAVVVRKGGGAAGTADEGRLVVVGDSDFAGNAQMRSQGNLDFFMNSVNWAMREESKISIRPQTPEMRQVDLKPAQAKWILYITVFIVPVGVFLFGMGIWFRRRAL